MQIWPKRQTVSFLAHEEDEEWQAPMGVITVEVMEARLPQRLTRAKKEKPLNPYAAVVVGNSQVPVKCAREPCAGVGLWQCPVLA